MLALKIVKILELQMFRSSLFYFITVEGKKCFGSNYVLLPNVVSSHHFYELKIHLLRLHVMSLVSLGFIYLSRGVLSVLAEDVFKLTKLHYNVFLISKLLCHSPLLISV